MFHSFSLFSYGDAKLFGFILSYVLLGTAGFLQVHGKAIHSACVG